MEGQFAREMARWMEKEVKWKSIKFFRIWDEGYCPKKYRGGWDKSKSPNLSFIGEEEIMEDSKRKRDVIKLKDDTNSAKEEDSIGG